MSTHEPVIERLSDYLDDELPEAARQAVAAHLEACDTCRGVLAELAQVRNRARGLTDTRPAANLWPGIAARVAPPATTVRPFRPRRTFSFTLPQLIAAGLALMVLSGSMVWLARLGGDRTDFPAVGARSEMPEATPVNFADEHYDQAIADLQEVLAAGRSKLDPQTVRVLEANLGAIDEAIEQCRRALDADPGNAYLNVHLADARKRKLALLREATALAGS